MSAPRIILADEHLLLADAIKHLLEPEFEVVAICTHGQDLIDRSIELEPDLIVLDVGLPGLNGLMDAKRLKSQSPGVKLLYLTFNSEPETIAEVFRAGASGYVLKSSAVAELIYAIRKVLREASNVRATLKRGATSSFVCKARPTKALTQLTLRQRQVLKLLADGRTMKEVAFMLDVSPRTIAFHKYSMMEQLSLRSTAELIHFAIKSSVDLTFRDETHSAGQRLYG